MIQKDKLTCSWAFWLSYSTGDKKETKYTSNIIKIHNLSNLADFAFVWQQSPVAKPEEFFTDPTTLQCNKFQIDNEMKKIDSICFFMNDIQPTWEYGDNSKGGYFNFSFSKDTSLEVVKKVYENLVFMSVGFSLSLCNRLRGIRIVDTVTKKGLRCRFELWMDYNQEKLNQVKEDSEELIKFIEELGIKAGDLAGKVNFFNIGGKSKDKNEGEKEEKS